MVKSIKRGGVEIRSSKKQVRLSHQNDLAIKQLFKRSNKNVLKIILNSLFDNFENNPLKEDEDVEFINTEFEDIVDGKMRETIADLVIYVPSRNLHLMIEFQTVYDKNMYKRNIEYALRLITRITENGQWSGGKGPDLSMPMTCNIFMFKKDEIEKKAHVKLGNEEFVIYNKRPIDFPLEQMDEDGSFNLIPLHPLIFADKSTVYDTLAKDEQKRKEFLDSYGKILDIFLKAVDSRRLSSCDAEINIRIMESILDYQLQKYPDIRRELKKMKEEKEHKINLFGIYVSEEESKRMDDRHKLVEELLDARDKSRAEGHAEGVAEGVAEGEQKKEKEIIFNMFAEGLDNETIIKFVPDCSFEDIANLRKEWLESISAKKAD